MLDYSPENLYEEAVAAEAHNKLHLDSFPDIIQTFVGSYYRSDMRPTNPSPENYPYSYVANVRPRLVFNNPRFNASSESTALNSRQVILQAKFVNRWAVQENLSALLIPYVTQALLLRSVIVTTFDDVEPDESVPADGLKQKMPHCHLLEPHRYFRDPVSTPAVPPRFKGHVWVRDIEDVKKMKGVSKEVLARLIPDVDLAKLQRPNTRQGNGADNPTRHEIVAYEIWVPECNDYRTDRGHNGTIFTVAVGQSVSKANGVKRLGKAFLLPPRPYYGPKWGPYTELEYIDVPGQTYGTCPVAVVMQQVEEVNAHLSATADAAARMKHLVFIDAANDVLQTSVQNSPDGSVIGIPNVNKDQVIPVLIGGPAPEQYEYNQVGRERLDRNIGMDASQRGGETQDRTATATNVQYETLNVRMKDLKRVTAASVTQIANTISWYGWESNNVTMTLGDEDREDLGMSPQPKVKGAQIKYLGGPEDGEKLPPWDAAALTLEPMSMEAVDEDLLAQQVMEALGLIAQLAQEMQTAPWLGYDVILAQLAKLRKFDWLEEAINSQLFAEWMKEQVSQQVEQHQSQQALTAAQIEGEQTRNALMKADLMLKLKELHTPASDGIAPKPPSVSIGYKDLPEDMKRVAERDAFGTSSTMPLTSPAHIQNAMGLHQTQQSQQHESRMKARDHIQQTRQSTLAGMFKASAGKMGKGGGMKSRSQRAQNGPARTASKGQKALQRSQ